MVFLWASKNNAQTTEALENKALTITVWPILRVLREQDIRRRLLMNKGLGLQAWKSNKWECYSNIPRIFSKVTITSPNFFKKTMLYQLRLIVKQSTRLQSVHWVTRSSCSRCSRRQVAEKQICMGIKTKGCDMQVRWGQFVSESPYTLSP